jgi:hypothetical protein
MRRTRPPASSSRIKKLRAGIEKWRRTRKKRSPMPEPLWDAAVELAQSEGVYPIGRALQLNYQTLKCRVAIASQPSSRRAQTPRGFVELDSVLPIGAFSSPSSSGPVLELSDGSGATLTVRLPAEGALDVERLAEAFLRRGLG